MEVLMDIKEIVLNSYDGFPLAIALFEVEKPKALIQLVHGALEHKERYYEFIKILNENNYTVLISDLRGHGSSLTSTHPYGYFESYKELIEDQEFLVKYLKESYPNLPVYLFGHSLGTMILRVYLQKYSKSVDKVLLTGAPNYIPISGLGVFIANFVILFQGKHRSSKLLGKLYNKPGDHLWLSHNSQSINDFNNDPMCGGPFHNNGYKNVFKMDKELHHFKAYKDCNINLDILLLFGEEDICTGGSKGILDTQNTLKKVGFTKTESKVYPNLKHEIINEIDNKEVLEDILFFYNK
jgi:alpha-beta hydrolase superfamily lysophospholipase